MRGRDVFAFEPDFFLCRFSQIELHLIWQGRLVVRDIFFQIRVYKPKLFVHMRDGPVIFSACSVVFYCYKSRRLVCVMTFCEKIFLDP